MREGIPEPSLLRGCCIQGDAVEVRRLGQAWFNSTWSLTPAHGSGRLGHVRELLFKQSPAVLGERWPSCG